MKKYTIENCPNGLNGIYKIDFPNGKSYIGLSNNIKRRILEHNYDKRQPVLFSAIKKYGKILEFIVLESGDFNREVLNEKEKYYISVYNTNHRDFGYNLTEGGYSYLGIYNPNAKFTEADLDSIKDFLENSRKSIVEISKIYECSEATIQRINSGSHYHNPSWEYPIRKERFVHRGKNNPNSKFENLEDVYKDLKNAEESMAELAEKYSCSVTTIRNINSGKTYFSKDQDYPIRKNKAPRKKIIDLSEEDINLCINLLIDKTLTMTEIGEKLGCSRDYIGEINQGRKFKKENLEYPLRLRQKPSKRK